MLYIKPLYDMSYMRFKLYLGQFVLMTNFSFLLFIYLDIDTFIVEIGFVISLLSFAIVEIALIFRQKDFNHKLFHNELKNE